ncbi:hypothetical protein LTR66_002433 [Elasticomyces elasticus]|nr:hypothetical protein LTR66_002433 [Elasticomyces elasticus]
MLVDILDSKRLDKLPSSFRASTDKGTPHDVPQLELDILQQRDIPKDWEHVRPLPRAKSLGEAHRVLRRRLGTPKEFRTTWNRLNDAFSAPNPPLVDLPFKVFNDLDHYLFRGTLDRQVRLTWERLQGQFGRTRHPEPHSKDQRLNIYLTKTRDRATRWTRHRLWEVLIHEMLHAYLYIVAIDDGEIHERTCRMSYHGRMFEDSMQLLVESLEFDDMDMDLMFQLVSMGCYESRSPSPERKKRRYSYESRSPLPDRKKRRHSHERRSRSPDREQRHSYERRGQSPDRKKRRHSSERRGRSPDRKKCRHSSRG